MPFDYISKDNIKVSINNLLLTNGIDYIYDGKNSIRTIKDITEAGSIIIRRITPISNSLSLKELSMVARELRDNMENLSGDIPEIFNNYKHKISAKLNECDTQIKSNTQELETTKENIKNLHSQWNKNDRVLYEIIGKIYNNVDNLQSEISNITLAHQSSLTEAEKKWKEKYNTLQTEYKKITEGYLNAICNLQNNWADTAKLLSMRIDNLSSAKRYVEPVINRRELTATPDPIINEVKLAINSETQQRRREDAQIKAFLKRLLTKYERLEDYIAGENIDMTDTAISELRREMRAHDDMLGRTDLETIVRLVRIKNKLQNKGE